VGERDLDAGAAEGAGGDDHRAAVGTDQLGHDGRSGAIDATSAVRLAGISSNEICVAFVVVPAMVVADSQVALDSAPLQAPARGTMVVAGGRCCELP
jgi:hypothetical protein